MPEYVIEVATRHFKRQFEKAVGKSILKVLAELLTNGDDSYRRLLQKLGTLDTARLTIEFDRRRGTFAVVDQAEGVSDQDMVERFVTYGGESGDRSAGARTRSLFGKGLRDVLFTQENGLVRSIKDGKAYTAKFRWRDRAGRERPVVDVQAGPPVTPELRKVWGIEGNGTRVEFRLRQDVSVPQYDRLARDLINFYMLRVLNSREDREIILRTHLPGGAWDERRLRYAPPADSASTLLGTEEWSFEFAGRKIVASCDLRAYEGEMIQGESSYDEREGGLLIVDEDDNVLDLTLLGFDEEPAAARLYGTLKLAGAGSLIRDLLNGDPPEEILTETRDGFERRHQFHRQLRSLIDPWLKQFVDAERQRLGSKPSGLSDDTRRRHERAFSRLNDLYRNLLGESTGLGSGPEPTPPHTDLPLEFRTPWATIRTGSYRQVQLLINTGKLKPGSNVQISSSDPSIVLPALETFEVAVAAPGTDTSVVPLRLEGLRTGDASVTAESDEKRAVLPTAVTDEETPDLSAGLAFHPDVLELRDGERTNLRLYADLRVVGRGDEPGVGSSNPKIEVLTSSPRWEPVTAFIVRSSVAVIGRGKGEESFITARLGDSEAVALVKVVAKRQVRDERHGGLFKGYKFGHLERKVQAILDTEGYVVINLSDPANRLHFGPDVESATRNVEERAASQTLLADLVLEECIARAVSEAYHTNKLKTRFPQDPTTDIRNYSAEKRFELGGEIHRLFVTKLKAEVP